MLIVPVLIASVMVQITAAVLALRLIQITERRLAWLAVTAAVLLMTVRRVIVLGSIFLGEPVHPLDVVDSWIALGISALIAFGIYLIGPIFESVKRSEEALRESEERFRTLVEQFPLSVQIFTPDGRTVYVNPAYARLWHASPEAVEYIKRHWNILEDTQLEAKGVMPLVRKAFSGEQVELPAMELQVERLDEMLGVSTGFHTAWVRGYMFPIKDERGDVRQVVLIHEDVTARIQAEQALKSSEERYRTVADFTYDWEYWIDTEGRFVWVSPSSERVTGYKPEEFIKDPSLYERIIHPDDRELALRHIHKALTTGDVLPIDFRIIRRDEEERWLGHVCRPVYGADGRPLGRRCSNHDITERKRAEQALKSSEERFRLVAETATDAIIMIDEQSNIQFANPAVERIFGYTVPEIIDHNFTMLMPERLRQKHLDSVREYIRTGKRHIDWAGVERPGLHKSGREVPLEISYGEFVREGRHFFIGIVRDITERKQAAESLKKANRTLRVLSAVNQALIRATEEHALLQEACRIIVDIGGYRMVWIGYAEDDPDKTVRPVAYAGLEQEYLEKIRISWADNELGRGPTGTAIRTGKPSFAKNIITDPRYAPWRAEAIKRGYASSISIPLIVGDRAIGALSLYSKETDAFDEPEVYLLTELAGDLAYGITSLRTREERAQALQALTESEERYRSLIELSPDGIVVHSEGKIGFINRAGVTIVGAKSPEEVIGKPVLDFVHPDYLPIVRERIRRMIEGRERYLPMEEEKFVRVDGTYVDVEVTGTPFTYQGKTAILVVFRDITERKEAERREREVEAHKREFYRRTILAATEGKLVIIGRDEIEKLAGPTVAAWDVERPEDLGRIRSAISEFARSEGMDEPRVYDFVLAVGEAITNAYKHAGGGTTSLHRVPNGLMFVVSDRGPGIEALTLPAVALVRGYSTAESLGMGYKAMIAVADRIYLATGPSGTTVAIEMGLHPAGMAAERMPSYAELLPNTRAG